MADYLYRRCGCENNGKQYAVLPNNPTTEQIARACPKMVDPTHGGWGFYLSAGRDPKTNKRCQVHDQRHASVRQDRSAREPANGAQLGPYRLDDDLAIPDEFVDLQRDPVLARMDQQHRIPLLLLR